MTDVAWVAVGQGLTLVTLIFTAWLKNRNDRRVAGLVKIESEKKQVVADKVDVVAEKAFQERCQSLAFGLGETAQNHVVLGDRVGDLVAHGYASVGERKQFDATVVAGHSGNQATLL